MNPCLMAGLFIAACLVMLLIVAVVDWYNWQPTEGKQVKKEHKKHCHGE